MNYQAKRKFKRVKSKMMMMILKMKEEKALTKSKRMKMISFKFNSKSPEAIPNKNSLKRLSNLFKKIWLKINLKITKCQPLLYLMNFYKLLL